MKFDTTCQPQPIGRSSRIAVGEEARQEGVPSASYGQAQKPASQAPDRYAPGIPVSELTGLTLEYLEECDLRLESPRTTETRRVFIRNLLWFLRRRGYDRCGVWELRQFFHYLVHGHEEPGGRFGRAHLSRPVRPVTVKDYYVCLRSLFGWLVDIGSLPTTPFLGIPKPQVREGIKAPLAPAQLSAVLQAASRSTQPMRNIAISSFLLDTGCRASELISLQLGDVDLANRCCTVVGKGNKCRTLYFGSLTAEALREYLEETAARRCAKGQSAETTPLFLSRLGTVALTRSGLLQLLERLGKECGIAASCSPHAFRRSFAVQTLRNGANVFSVQAMLGHSDLQMTQNYCALALTDVEAQHRRFSPVDRMDTPILPQQAT